jgi:hypothetical protein
MNHPHLKALIALILESGELDANGFRIYRRACEQFLNFFNGHTPHSHRQFLKDMAAVSEERFSIRIQFGDLGEPQTVS